MTDVRNLWRVAGILGVLALSGCDEETGLGDVDGDDKPRALYALALVNTTADITGPVHYVVQQGDSFVEGVLDEESAAGCEGQHIVGLWKPEVEVHAWTDSGLTWELALELEDGECVEEAVDFTNTDSILAVFAMGEETFLPAIVRLDGEFVGALTEVMTEEEFREWSELTRNFVGDGPGQRQPATRGWFLERIRAGRAVWATRPPGEYKLVLLYGNGGVFHRPNPMEFEDGATIFYWKGKGIFE